MMKMNRQIRIYIYTICWVAFGWAMLSKDLAQSRAAYEAGDLSANAWMGFWPFIFPMYWVIPLLLFLIVGGAIELVLWMASKWKERK